MSKVGVDVFKAAALKQRVITALVMAVGFLAVVRLSMLFWFQMTFAILFLIAAWEWANLSGLSKTSQRLIYVWIVLIIVCLLQFTTQLIFFPVHLFTEPKFFYWLWVEWFMALAIIFWTLIFFLVATYPRSQLFFSGRIVRATMGLFALIPAWAGVVFLKQQQASGNLVFWVVAIIALADIGAYFVGVRFGKHKLATAVSPGKSWEGVLGGILCNGLLVLILAVYWHLTAHEIFPLGVLTTIVIIFSIIGDLFESMMKRHRGVKDSGTLLPGHGGVLDRIDGWLAAVPVFTLAYIVFSL